ncbi:MAG: dynamin family protein [Nakamurella sp.]
MTLGQAADAVASAAGAAAQTCRPDTAAKLRSVAHRVDGKLVLAVAGRLKTGKSTLVNALLARDVAPTAATECTRLVTRFVRDQTEHLVIVGRDGSRTERGLESSRIPATLNGIDPDAVDHLDVHLATSRLDWLEIVDTPGLASLYRENTSRTEDFLDPGSTAAFAGADAVAMCFTGTPRADDVERMRQLLVAGGDRRGLATLGILNRADEITGGWDAARGQAELMRHTLTGLVADVIPTAALPGAAARCGLLDGALLAACDEMAALPADLLEVMLEDTALFVGLECPVDTSTRVRLLSTASLAGAAAAIAHLVGRPGDRAGAVAAIDAVSHLDALDSHLDRLRRRADALKAQTGIAGLRRIAFAPDLAPADVATVHNLIADLLAAPELAVIDELAVLEAAVATPGTLSPDLSAELDRLFTVADPAERLGLPIGTGRSELADHAWNAAARWQAISGSGPPAVQHAARIARRAYLRLDHELNLGEVG